jgi:uncharacterized membrane protein YdbT with pleckstrin-like domain
MELHPGEHVIFQGHPSWRSIMSFWIKGILIVALVVAAAGGITAIADDGADGGKMFLAGAIAFGILVVIGLIQRISVTYTISNQRMRIRRGIVSRHVQETRLERVQNVNTDQSVIERLLQVGTVDFDTAGTGDSDFAFRGVAQPEKVMAKVEHALREYAQEQGGVTGAPREYAPPPEQQQPPQPQPPQQA